MARVCLFEEYIYNLFLHFNNAVVEGAQIGFPLFFQAKRLNLNIFCGEELILACTNRLEFRRLGRVEQLDIPETAEQADKLEKLEKIWSCKFEFILALKRFYKTNCFLTKDLSEHLEIKQMVFKRISNLCHPFKPRKTKAEELEELKIDLVNQTEPITASEDLNKQPPIEKHKTKFKIFVEKAYKTNVTGPQTTKNKSVFVKECQKLISVRKLVGTHKNLHSLASKYQLSRNMLSQSLLENISLNIHSLNRQKENFNLDESYKLGQQLLEQREQSSISKRAIIETYLRNAYVTKTKLFEL